MHPILGFSCFPSIVKLCFRHSKEVTPASSLKSTRSSHSAQYCRYQTYSNALKNSFFPGTIPSVVNSQTAEDFRALLI